MLPVQNDATKKGMVSQPGVITPLSQPVVVVTPVGSRRNSGSDEPLVLDSRGCLAELVHHDPTERFVNEFGWDRVRVLGEMFTTDALFMLLEGTFVGWWISSITLLLTLGPMAVLPGMFASFPFIFLLRNAYKYLASFTGNNANRLIEVAEAEDDDAILTVSLVSKLAAYFASMYASLRVTNLFHDSIMHYGFVPSILSWSWRVRAYFTPSWWEVTRRQRYAASVRARRIVTIDWRCFFWASSVFQNRDGTPRQLGEYRGPSLFDVIEQNNDDVVVRPRRAVRDPRPQPGAVGQDARLEEIFPENRRADVGALQAAVEADVQARDDEARDLGLLPAEPVLQPEHVATPVVRRNAAGEESLIWTNEMGGGETLNLTVAKYLLRNEAGAETVERSLGSDILSSIRSLDRLCEGLPESGKLMSTCATDVILTLGFILVDPTPTMVASHLVMFARHHKLDSMIYEQACRVIETETPINEMDTPREWEHASAAELVAASPLASTAFRVLGMCSVTGLLGTLGIVNRDTAKALYKEFSFMSADGKADTLLSGLVRFLVMIVDRIRAVIMTGNLYEFLAPRLPFKEWHDVSFAILKSDLLRPEKTSPTKFAERMKELPPSIQHQMTEGELHAWACDLRRQGLEFKETAIKIENINQGLLNSRIKELEHFIASMDHLRSSRGCRIQPMGVYLYGSAGAGKSSLIQDVNRVVSMAFGAPCGPEGTYDIDISANFYDGVRADHFTYVYDDQDTSQGSLTYGQKTIVSSVIQTVNNKATQLEQADASLKGTVYANNKLTLVASNNDGSATVEKMSLDAGAFWRRMWMKVHVAVDAKYSSRGTLRSDLTPEEFDKARIFSVRFYDKEAKDYFTTPIIYRSFTAFLIMVRDKAREWFDMQNKVVSVLNAGSGSVCSKCCLPKQFCALMKCPGGAPSLGVAVVPTQVVSQPTPVIMEEPGLVAVNEAGNEFTPEQRADLQRDLDIAHREAEAATRRVAAHPLSTELTEEERAEADEAAAYDSSGVPILSSMSFFCLFLLLLHFMWAVRNEWYLVAACEMGSVTTICAMLQSESVRRLVSNPVGMYLAWRSPLIAGAYFLIKEAKPMTRKERNNAWMAYVREKWGPYVPTLTKVMTALTVLGGSLAIIMRLVKSKTVNQRLLFSEAPNPSVPEGYRPVEQVRLSPISVQKGSTMTESQWRAALSRSVYRVARKGTNGFVNAWSYTHPFYIAPKHFLTGQVSDSGRIGILSEAHYVIEVLGYGATHTITLTTGLDLQPIPGQDLVMMYLPELYPMVMGFAVRDVVPNHELDATHVPDGEWFTDVEWNGAISNLSLVVPETPGMFASLQEGDIRYYCHNATTKGGTCGSALIVFHGSRRYMAALHVTAMVSPLGRVSRRYAEPLRRCDIDPVMDKMAVNVRQRPFSVLVGSEGIRVNESGDVLIDPLKLKSAVANVAADGPHPYITLGTLNPEAHGSTMRSTISKSVFYDTALKQAESDGIAIDFAPPNGADVGVMRDGKWVSPFTNNMRKWNNGCARMDALLAAEDQVANSFARVPGLGRLVPLTLAQAIQGEGSLGPVPLSTAIGPPFTGPKSNFVMKDPPAVAEPVALTIDTILEVIRAGMREGEMRVPASTNRATLKQELLSLQKIEDREMRVFTVNMFATNILLKMYVSQPLDEIGRCFEVSGMAIGMNITSEACDRLIELLLDYAEGEDEFFDGDYKGQDVRTSTRLLMAAKNVIMRVLRRTSYTDEDLWIAECLVLSLVYQIKVIRSEVVLASFTNSSGNQLTAWINSITNLICLVYAYIRGCEDRGIDVKDYWEVFYAIVLGDDNLGARRREIAWFDMTVVEYYLAELGHVYTSSRKGEALVPTDPLESATFLKRSFRKDEESGRWFAQLDKKSLIKMVMYQEASSKMSRMDVGNAIMHSYSIEVFMHGRAYYDATCARWKDASAKVGHTWNSYDEMMTKYLRGELQSWGQEQRRIILEPVAGEIWMNESGTTELPSLDPSSSVEMSGVEQTADVPGGSPNESAPTRYFEAVQRRTKVARYTISNTTPVQSRFMYITPFETLLADPIIASRLENYACFRASLMVEIIIETQATAQGAFLFAPVCNSSMADYVDATPTTFASSLSVTGATIVNCCSKTVVRFTLPFVCSGDAHVLNGKWGTQVAYNSWGLNGWCISPLIESTSPTSACTGTITVYATFVEPEVYAPFNQANIVVRKKKASEVTSALSTAAGLLSFIPQIAPYATAASAGLAAASSLLDAFGFTKKSAPTEPVAMRLQHFSNVSVIDGVDASKPASFLNGCSVSIDPRVAGGTSEDESSFGSIFARPTFAAQTTWLQTHASGTVLMSLPVTPGLCFVSGDTGAWNPTAAGYIGAPFAKWKGSMNYTVVVTVSQLHYGSLQVYWSPTARTVGTVDAVDPTNTSYNCILDVTTEETKTFRVGWSNPWAACNMHLGTVGASWPEQTVNGYFIIAVQSPLRSSGGGGVHVTVAHNAGGDMRFWGVRPWLGTGSTDAPTTASLKLQTISDTAEIGDHCVLGGDEVTEDIAATLAGELVMSARALGQKMSRSAVGFDYTNASLPFTISIPYDFYGAPAHVAGSLWANATRPYTFNVETGAMTQNPPVFNWLAWLKPMFVGVRGGVRVKVCYCAMNGGAAMVLGAYSYEGPIRSTVESGALLPSEAGYPTITSLGPTALGLEADRGAEFQLPFHSSWRWFPGFATPLNSSLTGKRLNLVVSANKPGGLLVVYHGGSSDLSFVRFRSVPAIAPPSGGGMLLMALPPLEPNTAPAVLEEEATFEQTFPNDDNMLL